MVGYFSISRKLEPRRSRSRCSLWVRMLAVWIVAVNEAFAGWEQRATEAAEAVGLSPVSAWALVQLDPEHPISQKELAGRLKCNPSTVVDPTDRLEQASLVIRQPRPSDRRVNVLV